jgi:hypothetical protein
VLDIFARFLPLDNLSFRAWEASTRYHVPCAPFRANVRYENDFSYGDLAAMGNLPQYRQYRREKFSTDGFGFRRNSDRSSAAAYDVLFIGDSLIVGSGVNDEETLPARLEQHLGVGVYNGGGALYPPTLESILRLIGRLRRTNGTVLYEYFERENFPRARILLGQSGAQALSECQDWRSRFSVFYDGFVQTSPLQILVQKGYKTLQNDWLLPNASRSEVVVGRLRNGEPMLFYPPDINASRRRGPVDVSGFERLGEELKKRGWRLVVLLQPTKYTVYRSLLKDDDGPVAADKPYLDAVEECLRAANISTVNLLRALQQKAVEDYQQGSYIYWLDDTHWNAAGITVAADEILKRSETQ